NSSNEQVVLDRGSVVQIHSPLPISKENREIQSVRSLGSVAEFALRNRVIGASNHVSITNRLKFIDRTPATHPSSPVPGPSSYPAGYPGAVVETTHEPTIRRLIVMSRR